MSMFLQPSLAAERHVDMELVFELKNRKCRVVLERPRGNAQANFIQNGRARSASFRSITKKNVSRFLIS
jgi:hypothetical protein